MVRPTWVCEIIKVVLVVLYLFFSTHVFEKRDLRENMCSAETSTFTKDSLEPRMSSFKKHHTLSIHGSLHATLN